MSWYFFHVLKAADLVPGAVAENLSFSYSLIAAALASSVAVTASANFGTARVLKAIFGASFREASIGAGVPSAFTNAEEGEAANEGGAAAGEASGLA